MQKIIKMRFMLSQQHSTSEGAAKDLHETVVVCVQAFAFVTDLYMGTSNQNASFGNAVYGELASAGRNGGVQFNFTDLDRVTLGLGAVGVSSSFHLRSSFRLICAKADGLVCEFCTLLGKQMTELI